VKRLWKKSHSYLALQGEAGTGDEAGEREGPGQLLPGDEARHPHHQREDRQARCGGPRAAMPAHREQAVGSDRDFVRVPLTAQQQASLAQGGIAQIYHEFVEPREHAYAVSFEGEGWAGVAPVVVAVMAARDRLTFLELDLSRLDGSQDTAGLLTSIWYR